MSCDRYEPPSSRLAQELHLLGFALERELRATRTPDGNLSESVAGHTLSLSLLAIDVLERARGWAPVLRPSLVLRFALVHDLVEAECGDTCTFEISEADRAAKDAREAAARELLTRRFDALGSPWVGRYLREYESMESPEARLVYGLDKCCPKATHALNGGAALYAMDHDLASFNDFVASQRAQLAERCGDVWRFVAPLYDALGESVRAAMADAEAMPS